MLVDDKLDMPDEWSLERNAENIENPHLEYVTSSISTKIEPEDSDYTLMFTVSQVQNEIFNSETYGFVLTIQHTDFIYVLHQESDSTDIDPYDRAYDVMEQYANLPEELDI